jgi:hypothetical protein
MSPQMTQTIKENSKIDQTLIFKPLDPSMKKSEYTMPKLVMPAKIQLSTKTQLLANNQTETGKIVIIADQTLKDSEKFVVFNVDKKQCDIIDNQTGSVVSRTPGSEQDFQNSPVITEDTPIDILPGPQTTIQATQFPKIQLSGNLLKTSGGNKQIKLLPLSGMLEGEQFQQKQQDHSETDNHEKMNGQFIEVTADGEELAEINEDEFDEENNLKRVKNVMPNRKSLKYLKTLRYDLEKARVLIDLAKKREKLKLNLINIKEEYVWLMINSLDDDVSNLDTKVVFTLL